MEEGLMNFKDFIKEYFPTYVIDSDNMSTIIKIALWAGRNPDFEDKKKGYHLDKGLLLTGDVGTGKTDLFNLLKIYLTKYTKSRYAFEYGVAWKFTSDFSKEGYAALDGQEHKNRYYDELCMTDSRTKFPQKELAMHFGTKLLIGEELIMLRYNSFKRTGFQTHFSTNATAAELTEIYGERAFSRLTEMCNFLTLTGDDRRAAGNPNIYSNVNNPAPPPPKGIAEEVDFKKNADRHYIDFLENKTNIVPLAIVYMVLTSLKVQVATDDELRDIMEEVGKHYSPSISVARKSDKEKEEEKRLHIWSESKALAVKIFFQKLKTAGAKSIFGEVDVKIDSEGNKIETKKTGKVKS